MRLIRSHLRGFCQHLDTYLEFGERLTALRGPIGSGKTNAINGILFSLTGDVSRIPGLKADNICKSLPAGTPAFAETEFEHAGVHATIKRWLTSAKQELRVVGRTEVWTKDKDIKAELSKILGVSEKIITGHVFVEQWKIFDFLLRTHGEIAETFSRLFGLEKARQIHDCLEKAKIEVPLAHVDLDVARQAVVVRTAEVERLQGLLAGFAYLPDNWLEWSDPDSVTVRQWQDKQALITTADMFQAEAGLHQQEFAAADLERIRTKERLEEARRHQAELAGEVERIRADLAAHDRYDAYILSKEGIQTRLNETCDTLAALQEPERPAQYVDPEDEAWLSHARTQEGRLKQFQGFLKKFDPETGISDCPVCLTSGVRLAEHYAEIKAEAESLEREVNGLQQVYTLSKNYDAAKQHYQQRLTRLQGIQQTYETQLAELVPHPRPSVSRAELVGMLEAHTQRDALIARLAKDHEAADREAYQHFTKHLAAQKQAADKRQTAAAITVTEDQVKVASARLASKRSDYSEKLRLKAELRAAAFNLENDKASLAKAEEAVKLQARARRAREHLEGVRQLFHPDGLPKLVSQDYLESMQGEINEILADFEAGFRLVDVKDLRFVVRKGTSIQPASRLSGGEKVLFAIAFRLVVNSMFASDLGLLCLDEPTAGLDEESLGCLDVAMGRLRQMSQSRGLQVIVITHEKGLAGMFDRVIDLGQPR